MLSDYVDTGRPDEGIGPAFSSGPSAHDQPEHQHLGFRLLTGYPASQYSNSLQSWLLTPGNTHTSLSTLDVIKDVYSIYIYIYNTIYT